MSDMEPKHAEPKRQFRKIFCIGRNKTGTTSMADALKALGYRLGKQAAGELLLDDWREGRFDRIIALARSADAFQDVPFSLPGTYRALDGAFPGARFILTLRDNADVWFESMLRFHTKIVGKGRRPTAADLKAHPYRYPGYILKAALYGNGADETTLYDPGVFKASYEGHIADAQAHFAGRPGKLLTVNLADADAESRIAAFLGMPGRTGFLPHLNRTR